MNKAPFTLENALLFLRLGLPSTLICRENEAFRSSNRRNLKAVALRFYVDREHFENVAMTMKFPSLRFT